MNSGCPEGKPGVGALVTVCVGKTANAFSQLLKYRKEKEKKKKKKKHLHISKSQKSEMGKKGQLVFNLIKTCSWWKFILHI